MQLQPVHDRFGQAASNESDPALAAILSGLHREIEALQEALADRYHHDSVRLVTSTRNLLSAALDLAKDSEALRARDRSNSRQR